MAKKEKGASPVASKSNLPLRKAKAGEGEKKYQKVCQVSADLFHRLQKFKFVNWSEAIRGYLESEVAKLEKA